jgi:TfoX-like protein
MFGGPTFMVGGHMCCGVNKDELMVRLKPADIDPALALARARPMDFTGRPMRGFVTVAPDGQNGHALRRWVALALANAALSAKPTPEVGSAEMSEIRIADESLPRARLCRSNPRPQSS